MEFDKKVKNEQSKIREEEFNNIYKELNNRQIINSEKEKKLNNKMLLIKKKE